MNLRMFGASEEYRARGWSSMPLDGKAPILKQWANRGPDSFRGVLWPAGCNIGIVTGAASGLVVVDVDPKHGGLDSLFELEMAHGALPGPRVRTGSGGLHFYFKHPGGKVPNSVGKVAKGIDIRADGGQVVAPPSIHPDTGQRYVWEKTGDLPKMPEWLIEKLGLSPQQPTKRNKPSKTASEWSKLIEEGVREGGRNQAAASLTGYLLRHNLPNDVVTALIVLWNANKINPPLDDDELNSVLLSISKRESLKDELP